MADEKRTSRRSFLGGLLTSAAGGWVALASTGAVSAFLAACSRKKGSSASNTATTPRETVTKYGGPPVDPPRPMDMDAPPVATKYGGPSVEPRPMVMDPPRPPVVKYGGPAPMKTPRPMRPKPQAMKYGGRVNRPKKYGGPRRTKYGGIKKPKYGGVRRTKYGGARRDFSDVIE